jgi:ribosomal protein S18 acetylase RimI-like enzyme
LRASPDPTGQDAETVTVRPFAPADAPACAGIFDRAWRAGHPYAPRSIDLAAFERAIENERVVVAEADGVVLGFAAVYLPGWFVHHLYVEPTAFGRGIGRSLLEEAVRLAGGRATLKCQTRNGRAMAFYRRAGWTGGETGEEAGTGPWQRLHSPPGPQRRP